MGIISSILMGIGGIITLIGGVMLLVVAFKQSAMWGLGCIFVPFVSLVFLIKFWADAKKPFFICLAALPFSVIGGVIAGMQTAQAVGVM
jgi:hypothetical protein